MKTFITIMTVVVLSFAVTAFADDLAVLGGPDTGTVIYEASLIKMPIGQGELFVAEKPLADVGVEMYNSHLADQKGFSGARGFAAGGKGAVDETTRTWDELLAPRISDME
jgi:hypothetical protein